MCTFVASLAIGGPGAQGQAREPIVIGQSLPLGAADDGNSRRFAQGAQAQIEAVNARGGLQGRRLGVKTLDNGNDPAREAAKIRGLVQHHKAVAILGCQSDDTCKAASAVAGAMGVALVGPMPRGLDLSGSSNPHVFLARAPISAEAALPARQLRSLAVSRVELVVDRSSSEAYAQLHEAMESEGLAVGTVCIENGRAGSAATQAALQALCAAASRPRCCI